jgi:hypothetical protein
MYMSSLERSFKGPVRLAQAAPGRLEMGVARRVSAAVAVVACHAFIAAVFLSGYRRHSVPSASSESIPLIALPPEVTPPPRPEIDKHEPRRRSVAPPAPATPPPVSQPITETSPPVDWNAEAGRVAQQTLKRQSDSQHRTFGTWSRERVIEPSNADFAPGDTERFEDGEMRTWVSAHCYFTNRAPPESVAGAPSVWGKSMEVCQRSPRAPPARREGSAEGPLLP